MFAGPILLTRVYRRRLQDPQETNPADNAPEEVDVSAAAEFDLHGGFPIFDNAMSVCLLVFRDI